MVYDRVNKWGGAERVLLALRKIFPDAPLFTSVYEPKRAEWAKVFDVRTSFLQKFGFARNNHEMLAALMPFVFESFSFDDYDVVISVTSEAAKGIITKKRTKHICICLTPTRYLWSGYDEYFKGFGFKSLTYPVVLYLRWWDKIAAHRPDSIISISDTVKERVKNYYGLDSERIYPPLLLKTKSKKRETGRYFLVVSRLVPYKRVDLAVQAATKLKLPLKVVGTGSEFEKLKKMAGDTVEFVGSISDEELAGYYSNCTALIFPGIEDFGLVMVEAQSYGKPVIAFKGGGAKEIVIDGKTGVFFKEQTVSSLVRVLKNFTSKSYNSKDCVKNAERFSFEQFKKEFMQFFTQETK